MADVGEELQSALRHVLNLLGKLLLTLYSLLQFSVDESLCAVCVDGKGTCHNQQYEEADKYYKVHSLSLEVACSLVHSRAKRSKTALLSYGLVILHEQHACVFVRYES